jgi:hypothetical protein
VDAVSERRYERAALDLAELGYFVFPCRARGKEPLTPNGFHDATQDERTILQWWDRWPDANIGIACGASGLTVLDMDSKHGADPRELIDGMGLAAYPVVWTGEAPEPSPQYPDSLAGVLGAHIYFLGDRTTVKLPIKGVEIRGVGSYVIAPPSVHPSGVPYGGVLPAVTALPSAAVLPDVAAPATNGKVSVHDEAEVQQGDRHEALLAWARSRYTAKGVLGQAALDGMRGHNATFLKPPLPDGEVQRLWRWLDKSRIAESERAKETEDQADDGLGAVPVYPTNALPRAAGELVAADSQTLPGALVGGAMLAALAAAIGGRSALEVNTTWRERAILWVAVVAPAGAGKSPAQTLAFTPLREAEADVLVDDLTLEALARVLAKRGGAAAFDVDELAQLLRGLGEYKGGQGGDRGRLLARWEGGPWNAGRVGDGKKGQLGLDLRIPKPTVVICGGLQPHLHGILGGEVDGLRPRWLPHLAELPARPIDVGAADVALVKGWGALLVSILDERERERTWQLTPGAREAFNAYRHDWKLQARGPEPPGIAAALVKADKHLARVALVLAEADQPGEGGAVDAAVIHRAAEIVDFTLDSWRALPGQGSGLGLTRRDQVLGDAVERLAAWVEERPAKQATRRDIQRACVAGARTAVEVDALIAEHEARYPGSVTTITPEGGGLAVIVVHARRRSARRSVSALPTPDPRPRPNGFTEPKLAAGERADTVPPTPGADTGNGSTPDLIARLGDHPPEAFAAANRKRRESAAASRDDTDEREEYWKR